MAGALGLAAVLLAAAGCAAQAGDERPTPTDLPTVPRTERFTLRVPQHDHMASVSFTTVNVTMTCQTSGLAVTLESQESRNDLLLTVNMDPVKATNAVRDWEQVHADVRADVPWRRVAAPWTCVNGLDHVLTVEVMTARQREQYGLDE
ncbi:hypothetical protein [Streptomyces tirandamycinicus]|uniref:Lipoprotein n=1 Tax=Streptomyces tirandamycinicus TaxID=2174846 RepID=A0A2S1T246_9ACTN|nr:hypothetical protein [Streptomyces tirandamycinicus]AWI32739.1 hypothetical protein DDW44_30975 [Streptomyces tirandamycinicus]